MAHIRGHETDRLAALATQIRRLGGEVSEHDDGLTITPQSCLPRPLQGADCDSYADHRMATFGALVGLRVPGVRVANIETTAKTLPGFAQMWIDFVHPDLSEETPSSPLGAAAKAATTPSTSTVSSREAR